MKCFRSSESLDIQATSTSSSNWEKVFCGGDVEVMALNNKEKKGIKILILHMMKFGV